MTRATFDIIGLAGSCHGSSSRFILNALIAGFDYSLNALDNENNELYLAYKAMFDSSINKGQGLRTLVSIFFPILDRIWVRALLLPPLTKFSVSAVF